MATDGASSDPMKVPPLDNTAFFDIDTREGYVRVDQSLGNRTLYTPEEARDIAESIIEAAEDAEPEP